MLILEAQLSRFSTMADGGTRIQMDTGELTPEVFAEIGKANKKMGAFVFKPDTESLSEEQLKEIKSYDVSGLGDKKKSKSQRLRAVLFRMYEQDNEGFIESQDHYDYYLNTIINHFKKKLDGEV
ncbi:MAG: hypothetical protein KAS32_01380 [Candidatus Peribacteraceae bacterium]|nr:hypothetical protein [Candidatus Peribacteraceae bacterium]